MSAEWHRVRAVLESALEHSLESRRDYIEQACQGDDALRSEVNSLLSGLESDPDFLEGSKDNLMARSLGPAANAPTGTAFAPGAVVAERYEILKTLGEGGMGTVYKARDRELDRIVALKVIRPELAGKPEILRRFKQELILACQVTHRNVIRIFDLGIDDDLKFITMDFVEGQDLKSALSEKRKFTAGEACEVIRQICLGLEAAHNEGVIHRDLKPQNIMLDTQGRIYLMDFGLARSMELVGMTRTGALLGTPAYMSPEQAKGEKVDARTDLFSLGVIFYELLTGVLPYRADSMMATLIQRSKEPATPPNQLEPSIPPSVNDVVMKCLQISPERRYQHAGDILQDLAAKSGAPSQKWKPTSRQLAMAVPVLLAVLLFAVPQSRHTVLSWIPATGKAPAGPTRGGKYVAILPFRPSGDDASLQYTATGISDELSARLSQVKEVHLASPAASVNVSPGATIPQIARSLGAKLLVQGGVVASADQITVTAALDDPATGCRLWTEQFSGRKQDLLTIEDHVYTALLSALDLRLSKEEKARDSTRLTGNIGAYELYLKGRALLTAAHHDAKSLKQAADLFDQSTQLDPAFTLAYAGVADSLKSEPQWQVRALGAANRAEGLNDSLPEVHFTLAGVYTAMGRRAEAVAELRRALELAPNSDDGYRLLGRAYLDLGNKTEALNAFDDAVKANPYYWSNYSLLGEVYAELGDQQQALKAFEQAIQLDPHRAELFERLAGCYQRLGQPEKAREAHERANSLAQETLETNR